MAEATIPKIGGEVAGIWRTSPFATDLTAELTAIKAAGAHVIYTFTTGPSGTVFIKQWGEIQFTAPVVGHTTDGSSKKFWVSTGGMCNYIASYGQSGRVEMTDKSIPFYDKLSARTGDYPSDHTGTYEVLYILKEAIERTGTLDSDAVVVALEKTDHIGPSGRSVYNPNDHKWPHELIWGPGYRTSLGNQWQNGELKTFWPRGKAVLGDKKWEGVRYKGTVDYQLPPWVIKYWKSK
jgi:branched-chain amino acid transport system substrate-binding protein